MRLYECDNLQDLTVFLKQDYANNLYFFTYLHHIEKNSKTQILISRDQGGNIVLALLLTPIHCCISAQDPAFIEEAADQLPVVDSLYIVGRQDLHEKLLHIIKGPRRSESLYALCEQPLTTAFQTLPHKSRRAGQADLDALIDFYSANDMLSGAESRLPEILSWGTVYIRQVDQQIASCALTTTETEDAAMIGAVYTRPEYRGYGYARDCITSLCSELMAEQKRPCLFYKSENELLKRLYESLRFEQRSSWILATRE